MGGLDVFHPAVRAWFEARFPLGPTEPQLRGWPAIASGRDTLIAAPTGSGKTLAAFLVCLDRFFREAEAGQAQRSWLPGDEAPGVLPEGTQVVYVSPLKALAVDIAKNLTGPLAEIRAHAEQLGLPAPEIRIQTRSGDTTQSERAAMLRKPPHILVTTPESLYLMVTAAKSRESLRGVHTVIVDEIHAVARDKRGSHLALTLERLSALCDTRPTRIGLSATQRPIDVIARLLVGAGPDASEADGSPRCQIVDEGHRRVLDVAIEVPGSELGAVASAEQWAEILDRIAEHASQHKTTLVFSNTRRLAERAAHQLGERIGEDEVCAHHGSLSKERRLRTEERLRAGDLKLLVATASLELGIDIGPVELVCQLGSPRSIATFLQRVGRSGHARGQTPKGRLFPTTRDELVECAALVRGMTAGRLDRVLPPEAPLDILAQQIVAECAAQEWKEAELLALFRRAAPFATLSQQKFDEVVELLSEGIATGRGRRAAYLHRDRIHGVLRARRGARLAALTSGGAIPDTADYRVVADPDDTFVGTVNEDWAIESMAGDIFLLGTTSWRIRRVEPGVVRVRDAEGLPPTIPFWLGEAPARSEELSREVSDLRRQVQGHLEQGAADAAEQALLPDTGLDVGGAAQVVRYLHASHVALGALPTWDEIVIERFFDDTGGMQLVVHAPFGGRVNRAFGLAVRKRICRSFDFELQAAANDDTVVLSLGPQHSFPLEDFTKMLASHAVREAVSQAVLDSPMFTARWRWNLGRALAVLRFRGGRKNPPPIQRMEADDIMAAVFPGLAQCQEHQAGPIELPDHPLVHQTIDDCLTEAMDVDALEGLMQGIEAGEVRVRTADTTEPSPLSHEILNGRPFTFLDDAPLEERRTRAVSMTRGLPTDPRDLTRLDPGAIDRVKDEIRPQPRDAEELHDLLVGRVWLQPVDAWQRDFDALVAQRRATVAVLPSALVWLAAEQWPAVRAVFPDAQMQPALTLPPALERDVVEDDALSDALRGFLETSGPASVAALGEATWLSEAQTERGLARLEGEGFALRGRFDPRHGDAVQYCARRLLGRIHAYTRERLRREIEPVTAQDFYRFLLRWQHATTDTRREGRRGVLSVIEQLQGYEVAAGSWEPAVLRARVADYRPEWLDALCLSGDVAWGRLGLREASESETTRRPSPSRVTRLALSRREDWPWLQQAVRGSREGALPEEPLALALWQELGRRGALFHGDLARALDRDTPEVESALWELVSRGLVTADGFESLRVLLGGRRASRRRVSSGARARLRRGRAPAEGRWSQLETPSAEDRDSLAEAVAEQLLARWGVVFFDLFARENLAVPWRDVLWALRRLEDRGLARGGRFVTGFSGEQFALPGALDALRRTRRRPRRGELVVLSAVDPLNLTGVLTPGARVPAQPQRKIVLCDGALVEGEAAAAAS
jgi:ATP-dependent Lhr-like helicase